MCEKGVYVTVKRGPLMEKSDRPFTGIFHTVTFQLNKPASLVGLTFFGPRPTKDIKKGRVDYTVHVCIQESKFTPKNAQNLKMFYDLKTLKVQAEIGENFSVEFEKPIPLPSEALIDVDFLLEGLNTGHMSEKDLFQTVLKDDRKFLQVKVLPSSSKQLTAFHFQL